MASDLTFQSLSFTALMIGLGTNPYSKISSLSFGEEDGDGRRE